MLDPKWLTGILEAGGWKSFALTAASAIILVADHFGLFALADIGVWVRPLVFVSLIVFGCLWLASAVASLTAPQGLPRAALAKRRTSRERKAYVEREIGRLTGKERDILSYLVSNNIKTFPAASDGGYAATLISRRLVVLQAVAGQRFDHFNVPFTVCDDVWELLQERADEFRYTKKDKAPPWRIPVV